MRVNLTWLFLGFILGIALGVFIYNKTSSRKNPEVEIKYIERTIEIPGSSGSDTNKTPEPIYIENKINQNLINEINELREALIDTGVIERIIEATKKRYYEDVAFDTATTGDTLLKVVVQDSVLGEKIWSAISWKIYDREFSYIETHTTLRLKPKFALFAGTSLNLGNPLSLQIMGGIRTKKGWSFGIGHNTLNQTSGYLGKDLLIKY